MTSVSSRPVARLSSPGDIVATVPTLCGFVPQDSVVLLSLRGPRRRLGLTVRLDLPPPELAVEVAESLVSRLVQDGAAATCIVVFADCGPDAVPDSGPDARPDACPDSGPDARPDAGPGARPDALVAALRAACERAGVTVAEALHVARGRWTSWTCAGPCCPPEGTPVPEPPALVQAVQAHDGRAVLGSRDDLVRSLAAPAGPLAVLARVRLDLAGAAWLAQRQDEGVAAARRSAVGRARRALRLVEEGGALSDDETAALAVVLHDVGVRDEVATWALRRSDGLLALAEQVARRAVAPHDAPVCTLVAWVAYARGDGGRANVALDRAQATDPDYPLAGLLRAALDGGLGPAEVRRSLRATRRALRPGQRGAGQRRAGQRRPVGPP